MFTFDIPLISILEDIHRDLTYGSRKDPLYLNSWRTTAPSLVRTKYPTKPPMDHTMKDDGTNIFEIAACGLAKEDLSFERNGNVVTISVLSQEKEKDENDVVLHHTLVTGGFPLSIKVPEELDIDNIDASLTKGILKITIPPKPENVSEKKLIEIK